MAPVEEEKRITTANPTAKLATVPNSNLSVQQSRWKRAYAILQTGEASKKYIAQYERILSQEILDNPNSPLFVTMTTNVYCQQVSVLADKKLKEAERSASGIQKQVDQIVKSILFFKDFVSVAITNEPHAALAWAGVCIFLPIVLNQMQQREALAEGVEQISDLCCRYFVIEATYDDQRTTSFATSLTELERRFDIAIVKLYTRILEYQARIICQLSRSRISQNVLNILKHNDWKELLGGIMKADSECQGYIKVLDSTALREGFEYQRREMDELFKQNFGWLKSRFDTERRDKCISMFRTTDYERHKERIDLRAENTCNWVLDHMSYRHWCDSNTDDILWITAYPGCGKTVLCRFLVENVLVCEGLSVCYFFFNETVEEQRSASNALCGLLHQLFTINPYLHEHALPAMDRNGTGLQTNYTTLWSIFEETITDPRAGNIICIIDAIDECALEEYRGKRRVPFLGSLMNFFKLTPARAHRSTTIKFFLTSRPYHYIENHFEEGDIQYARLAGENESANISQEIDTATRSRVRKMNRLSLETRLKLEKKLLETRNRTYLWLTLILAEIEEAAMKNERKLLRLIEEPPSTVDAAYDSILSKSSKKKDDVIKLLHIIVAAVRPLTLQEIDVALAADWRTADYKKWYLEEGNIGTYIRDLCGLFVTVIDSQVSLIHQTAKVFLVNETGIAPAGSWKHSLDLKVSHQVLAEISLSYLVLDMFSDELGGLDPIHKDVKESYPKMGGVIAHRTARKLCQRHHFLDYSANHWAHHLRHTQTGRLNEMALEMALKLCDVRSLRFAIWFLIHQVTLQDEIRRPAGERSDFVGVTPLIVAILMGLEVIARKLVFNKVALDAQDAKCRTALHYTALLGSEDITRDLLNNRARHDIKDDFGVTALHYAVWGGHKKVLQLLLEFGAAVDARDRFGTTPLQRTTHDGNHEILTQLLNHGADANAKDQWGTTAFHIAAERKDTAAMVLLLPYTSVNVRGVWERTALHEAALRSDTEIIRLLLSHNADPNALDKAFRTPLHVAVNVHNWRKEPENVRTTIKLLIMGGADVNITDIDGYTAHSLARESPGNEEFLDEISKYLSPKDR